jgi:hypothetical protein
MTRVEFPLPWAGHPNMRLGSPATFFIISVCPRRRLRHRSLAIRQIFISPIPCSTTIRRFDTRRWPASCRAVSDPFRGRRVGVSSAVPWYAVSPVRFPPGGPTTRRRSYTLLSCVSPANILDTAAIRTRRGCPARPGVFRFRTTTWCFTVCPFFFPE